MNNEQNKDPRRRRLSIDGVSPKPSRNGGSIGFDKPASNRPAHRKLDDFKRGEGFSARSSSNILIDIPKRPKFDTPESKRRGLFGRRKHGRVDSFDRKKRRRRKLKIAAVVVLILVALLGFLMAKGYINLKKVFEGGGSAAALEENVDPSKLHVEGDGRINILVLGRGGLGHEGPDLTDTIILMSIDPISKKAGLVSIPRDLYVSVPGEGSMKINSVYYTGKAEVLNHTTERGKAVERRAQASGFKLMEKTVEDVLGVPVHYHVMVDFSGFKEAINTVGGVDINVPQSVYENMRIDGRNYTLNVKAGPHHFRGFEALAYSRSRHTSQRGDFDRAERQRLMIVALKNKILSLSTFSNPSKLTKLSDQFGNHVQTNFSTGDISKLYELMKTIDSSDVKSIGLSDPPNDFVTTAYMNGLSVVLPTAGLNNYDAIRYYIRTVLRDSYLNIENARVVVLNGTERPGLARDKAHELRSYGYWVVKEDNAPNLNYPKTILIDMKHGDKKYTRHYLEKRFGAATSENVSDQALKSYDADFVIILGNDNS
jgi:LCP family protein required for cell wall assembly